MDWGIFKFIDQGIVGGEGVSIGIMVVLGWHGQGSFKESS